MWNRKNNERNKVGNFSRMGEKWNLLKMAQWQELMKNDLPRGITT